MRVVFQNEGLQSMWQIVEQEHQEHTPLLSGRRWAAGGRCHALTRMWRESLAAPVDAKTFATASSSGGTSFAACGDGLSDQGASEHEAKCPRGAQQRSRHVRDALPE